MARHRYVAARPLPSTGTRRLGPRRFAYHKPTTPHPGLNAFFRRLLFFLLFLLGLIVLVSGGLKLWVDRQTEGLIYAADDDSVPRRHVAMVFGAGLSRSGGPSAVLYDRVETAAELYLRGDVDKLLMTGDNSTVTHNEVEAMRRAAVELGVADGDIVLDYAGFSTWDSCYRGREIFSLAEATLVTQRFHLPRAIFTCNQLGIDAIGVAADKQPYRTQYTELREIPALVSTGWNLLTGKQPTFLGPKVNVDDPQYR